jgi:hypothetical protein
MNQTIEPAYVTFEQAKLINYPFLTDTGYSFDGNILIRKGFIATNGWINRPEQWQVVEWLRVNYGIWINVDVEGRNMDRYKFVCFRSHSERVSEYSKHIKDDTYNGRYDKPQDALSAAFDYVLNNLI